jgi:KaiC/GvpD/RAD55 family RecA-like ATPase
MVSIPSGSESFDKLTGGLSPLKTYLLNGNRESGKEELAYRLSAANLKEGRAVVYITVNKGSSELLNDFLAHGLNISQHLGQSFKIIDDFSRTISPESSDNQYTKVVNGPVDLTGLSVAMSSMNNDFVKDGKSVINVLDSLSTLLLYNNTITMFRFLQFVCGRAKTSGVTSLFLLNSDMHANDVTESIKSLMDGVINVKLEDGKRFFTISGSAKEVLSWSPL